MEIPSAKDIVGLTADIMTLLGLGGLFTWSFVRKEVEAKSFPDIGINVFALAVKVVLCFTVFTLAFTPLAAGTHFSVVFVLSGNYVPSDGWWNEEKALVYVIAYALTIFLWLPISVLTASSIVSWSLSPFKRFWHAFTRAGAPLERH